MKNNNPCASNPEYGRKLTPASVIKANKSNEHLQEVHMPGVSCSSALKDRSLDPYSRWNNKYGINNSFLSRPKGESVTSICDTNDLIKDNLISINRKRMDGYSCKDSCSGTFLPVIGNKTLPYMLDSPDNSVWNDSNVKMLIGESINEDIKDKATLVESYDHDKSYDEVMSSMTKTRQIREQNKDFENIVNKIDFTASAALDKDGEIDIGIYFCEETKPKHEKVISGNVPDKKSSTLMYDINPEKNIPLIDNSVKYLINENSQHDELFLKHDSSAQIHCIGVNNALDINEQGPQLSYHECTQQNECVTTLRYSQLEKDATQEGINSFKFCSSFQLPCRGNHEPFESLINFGNEETVYEGFGENYFKGGPLYDEKSQVKQNILSAVAAIEGDISGLFQACNPDEEGFVVREDLTDKLYEIFGSNDSSCFFQYLDTHIKEAGPKISFEVFKNIVIIVAETILGTNESETSNMILKNNSVCVPPVNCTQNQEIVQKFTEDIDGSRNCHAAIYEFSDEYRRSTLLPGHPHLISKIMGDMTFPSPIKPLRRSESQNSLYKRNNDFSTQEKFDFTCGSLEAEGNLTPLDPIDLQHEVFELTHSNRKLTGENEELAANISRFEEEQNTLRDKIRNLEAQLNIARQQAVESQHRLQELYDVKSLLEKEKEKSVEFESRLAQATSDKQALEDDIKRLQEEVTNIYEKLDCSMKQENMTNLKNNQFSIENSQIKEGFQNCQKMLRIKEEEIHYLKTLYENAQKEMQSLTEEKLHILDELHDLKQELSDKLPYVKDFSGRNANDTLRLTSEDSHQVEVPNTSLVENFKDNCKPRNIQDEIFSLDSSMGSLPFCEKGVESSLPVIRNIVVNLEDALTNWSFWSNESVTLAQTCVEEATSCDSFYHLLVLHFQRLGLLTDQWRELLNNNLINQLTVTSDNPSISQSSYDISSSYVENSKINNGDTLIENDSIPEVFLRETRNSGILPVTREEIDQEEMEIFNDSFEKFGNCKETSNMNMALQVYLPSDLGSDQFKRSLPDVKRAVNENCVFEYIVMVIFTLILMLMFHVKRVADLLGSLDNVSTSNEMWELIVTSVPFFQIRRVGIPPS